MAGSGESVGFVVWVNRGEASPRVRRRQLRQLWVHGAGDQAGRGGCGAGAWHHHAAPVQSWHIFRWGFDVGGGDNGQGGGHG
jgi:hypothetical protein